MPCKALVGVNAVVAQACSLRIPGNSTALKGLKTGQGSAKNRSKARPSHLKWTSGLSCDECLLVSTQQGADYGGGAGRTFRRCNIADTSCSLGAGDAKGCNVCMIPQKENSAAGSDLSKFSKQSRVLTDDPFYVPIP